MDKEIDLETLRVLFRSLANTCATVVQHITTIQTHLDPANGQADIDFQNNFQGGSFNADSDRLFEELIIDSAAKTVTYRGRACRLGNTLAFRLLERLARRPNQFLPFDRLIRDVWDGHPKSDEAIRSLTKELRDRLRKAGMRKLASSIQGQRRAYCLALKQNA